MATCEGAAPDCSYDVVVIGAGIQGTFAAYHLAKRGQRTLLLEQFFLPHTRGSSHGQSRIIRRAYPQDHYSAMMAEAYRLWAAVEAEAHTKLYKPTPLFVLGHQGNPEFESYRQSMERNGVSHEVLSARDLAGKFPGLRLEGGAMAVSDLTAGILYADKALKAVQDLLRQSGGTVQDGEKVLSILPGTEVTIITSRGKYRTKRLVVTAGAWANRLLNPLGVQLPLQPLRINVCYWKAKDQSSLPATEQLPCFLSIGLGGNKHHVYGLPAGEYPGLVKICYHHGSPVDPDSPDQPNSSAVPDVQILWNFVSKYMPVLDPEPAVQERCLYTNTPDEDFVLDCHPRFRNIIIGAGFSGHGFKFAPVIGKILCELSLGEKPSYNLVPFQIHRFASPLKAAM